MPSIEGSKRTMLSLGMPGAWPIFINLDDTKNTIPIADSLHLYSVHYHSDYKMLEFRTQGYQGYSVKYSPFFDSRLSTATSANFGLVGNGRLYILNLTPNGIVAEKWYVHFLHLASRMPRSPLKV